LFVVLIGPDGSGKSTVADGLQQLLAPLFSKPRYYHGHFGILPRLRDLARLINFRKPGDSGPEEASSSTIPGEARGGRLRSLTYLLYYTLDYFLGHAIMFSARGKGELIVFDRYYYDYLIQPDMTLSDPLLSSLMRLVPQPDVVVYLKNKPATIHQRKPELSLQELARQGAVCTQILSRLGPAGHTVETGGTPEDTVRLVVQVLMKKMADRNRVRRKDFFP
jgi:thymidylate kinase